jgi:hypothetical protein
MKHILSALFPDVNFVLVFPREDRPKRDAFHSLSCTEKWSHCLLYCIVHRLCCLEGNYVIDEA